MYRIVNSFEALGTDMTENGKPLKISEQRKEMILKDNITKRQKACFRQAN